MRLTTATKAKTHDPISQAAKQEEFNLTLTGNS